MVSVGCGCYVLYCALCKAGTGAVAVCVGCECYVVYCAV